MLERLEHELDVIESMGFSAYFLVVWDLVHYAKSRGIRVGPGRGSAAGSCVAYCLRIVDIDPIKYDLLFERFLNPGRKQMPDIDMDFDSRYRGEMIKYAAQRYGADHVAQIVTFSTIKARAAVRDAARVLDYPYGLGDKIAKLMPPLIMGRDTPLHACLEKNPKFEDGYKMAADLREFYESDPDGKRVIDVAKGLEGLRRQDGIHAAAVVITREPLTEYLPVQRKPEPGGTIEDAPIVTQYEMHGVEDLGLLKMDFLGLRNLDVIEITLELVEQSTGVRPDIDDVPLDDPKTFDLLRAGDTIGVFQLEGGPMRALIRSVAPSSFEDVSAVIALYRPGPMAQNWHNEYADRKNGRKPITYPHPALEELLAPTYGLMVYQEQLMRVSQQLAGYSLEDADNLRKATGKKIRELIVKERSKFVDGCVAQGHERAFGEQMFDTIEPFADYSFNKSHTVGYGLVTYQTAYLKANHPREYLAALLTSVKGDKDKSAVYLNECRQMEIPVLVPDVNESAMDFVVRRTTTGTTRTARRSRSTRSASASPRCATWAKASSPRSSRRDEGGPVRGLLRPVRAGRPVGAEQADRGVADQGRRLRLARAPPPGPVPRLRGDRRRDPRPAARARRRDHEPVRRRDLGQRRRRRELRPSADPGPGVLEEPAARVREGDARPLRVGPSAHGSRSVRCGATPTRRSPSSRRCARARCARSAASSPRWPASTRSAATSWRRSCSRTSAARSRSWSSRRRWRSYGELLTEDAIVCVKARIDMREDAAKLIAMEITQPPLVIDGGQPVRIRTRPGALNDPKVARLKEVLLQHPGDSPVLVYIEGAEKTTVVSLGDDHLVTDRNGLFAELRVLLGADCILAPDTAQSLITRR